MRVLFINPDYPVYLKNPALPLGLLSIASYLKQFNHDVLIYDRKFAKESLPHTIQTFQPQIVGISVISFLGAIDAKEVTKYFREHTEIPVVWGGHTPSAVPEMIFEEAKPHYIIFGEGEITWLELLDALQSGKPVADVKGLIYTESGKIQRTPARESADLSTFPSLDWSLIRVENYFSNFFLCDKMQYLHATKGCFGSCTFCPNKQFHNSKNRCRNLSDVLSDIDYLVQHGTNGIYFSDELFIPNRSLRTEFCNKLIERNYDLVWGCMMRIGILQESDVELMYRAGCRWILFGIESGDPKRIDSIQKRIDLSKVHETVAWCDKAQISVIASFIIGYPDETVEELQRTIRFAQSIKTGLLQVNIYMPIPNSEMFQEVVDRGLYRMPKTIKECAKQIDQKGSDVVAGPYACVPPTELRVVHFYFQWKAFMNKDSVKGDSYGVIKKLFRDMIKRITNDGLKSLFFGLIMSVKQFLTVFFYANFFPSIRKKYGLK